MVRVRVRVRVRVDVRLGEVAVGGVAEHAAPG